MRHMSGIPGIAKPDLHALPAVRDRMTFLYVERCLVSRQDGAVSITDSRGTAYVPAASLGVLMLGPGTNISHRAVELLGDSGSSVVWVASMAFAIMRMAGRSPTHPVSLQLRLSSFRIPENDLPSRERCMACDSLVKTFHAIRCSS